MTWKTDDRGFGDRPWDEQRAINAIGRKMADAAERERLREERDARTTDAQKRQRSWQALWTAMIHDRERRCKSTYDIHETAPPYERRDDYKHLWD